MDDGRFHNNGWMQEWPDPITKITWDNVILMSRHAASELDNLQNKEVVEVELEGRKVEGPVWIQPGFADFTLGLALGYGRAETGRVGSLGGGSVGYCSYQLRGSQGRHFTTGAKVRRLNKTHTISCTQDHWSMEGRAIVREANLENFETKRDFAQNMDLEAHTGHILMMPTVSPNKFTSTLTMLAPRPRVRFINGVWPLTWTPAWVAVPVLWPAGQNNIPIVGKDQVANSREMHWMRIDRYYSGDPRNANLPTASSWMRAQAYQEWIDDVQVVNQPMLCQHCESAPCESVCPVNATVHDHEGLNVMAYNRCVGTRYCSNNCAYKVRRFNYFDYNKRPIDQLDRGPWATLKDGFIERPEDEVNLVEMARTRMSRFACVV